MEKNVGSVDRLLRIAIGALLIKTFFDGGKFRWFGLLGIMPLTTGITGQCGAYEKAGISTRRKKK